jgi:hypothetical protein
VAQLALAFARLHCTPQAPQLAVVRILTSQPSEYRPLQFAKPSLQPTIVHTEFTHSAVPLAAAHTVPQAPQLVAVFVRLTSQPLAGEPSQSPSPGAQLEMPQVPFTQFGVPPTAEQTLPQVPQLLTSELLAISQPFVSKPSQLRKPALQLIPHMPAEQVGVPFWLLQTVPQAPQCSVEVFRFVSQPFEAMPSQSAQGVVQEAMAHAPPEQTAVAFGRLQAAPQAPQCETLVRRLTSQPSALCELQLPNPSLQEASAHEPAAQVGVAFAKVQALPQAPQWKVDVFRLVSQPFAALPSQLPEPWLQAIEQFPPAQLGMPLVALQALPQAPQCVTVLEVLTSQPVAYCRSQSAQGAVQLSTPQVVPLQVGWPCATLHCVPQAPQALTLFVSGVSQPSPAAALQLPKPAEQTIPHWPPEQKAEPFVPLQAAPQAPQCPTLVEVSVSQPFAGLPSQSANGAVQDWISQVPVAQVATAFGSTHSWPQAPQFRRVCRLASQPSS